MLKLCCIANTIKFLIFDHNVYVMLKLCCIANAIKVLIFDHNIYVMLRIFCIVNTLCFIFDHNIYAMLKLLYCNYNDFVILFRTGTVFRTNN